MDGLQFMAASGLGAKLENTERGKKKMRLAVEYPYLSQRQFPQARDY